MKPYISHPVRTLTTKDNNDEEIVYRVASHELEKILFDPATGWYTDPLSEEIDELITFWVPIEKLELPDKELEEYILEIYTY